MTEETNGKRNESLDAHIEEIRKLVERLEARMRLYHRRQKRQGGGRPAFNVQPKVDYHFDQRLKALQDFADKRVSIPKKSERPPRKPRGSPRKPRGKQPGKGPAK
jgi:hypothetical protein